DPFASTTFASFPACQFGTSFAATVNLTPNWVPGAGAGGAYLLVPPGVYCSNAGGINIAGVSVGGNIDTTGSVFLSTGPIRINANGTITMAAGAANGGPNKIVAYTTDATPGCGAGGIVMGFGTNYSVTGSMYALFSCINGRRGARTP